MLQNLLPYCSFWAASQISPCAFPCPLFIAIYPQPIYPRNFISPEPVPLEILPLGRSLGNAGISLPHSPADATALLSQEQTGQVSVLAPPGITSGQ